MSYQLYYVLDGREARIEIPQGETTLGRGAGCGLVIGHASVSSQHVKLELSGQDLFFHDMLSRNGTIVNGVKVSEGRLRPGDVLRLGKVDVKVMPGGRLDTPDAPLAAVNGDSTAFADNASRPQSAGMPVGHGGGIPTPAEGVEMAVVVSRSSAIEVLPPSASRSAGKNKKLVVVGACVLVSLAMGVILALPEKPAANIKPVPSFSPADYWRQVLGASELYRKRDYAKASEEWKRIASDWDKANTNTPLRTAKDLSALASAMADARRSGSYLSIDWLSVNRDLTNLIKSDEIANDDVSKFVDDLKKQATRETQAQQLLVKAKDDISANRFDDAMSALATIPSTSVFSEAAVAQIDMAKEQRFSREKESLENMFKGDRWEDALAKAKELLALRPDDAAIAKIRDESTSLVNYRAIVREGRELAVSTDLANRRSAIAKLSQIPAGNRFHEEAQQLIVELKRQEVSRQINEYFRQGNLEALQKMGSNKEVSEMPSYSAAMTKIASFQKYMDEGNRLRDGKDYDSARIQWKLAAEAIGDDKNAFASQANRNLDEWSLLRLGQMAIDKGNAHLEKGEGKQARACYQAANDRYGVNASESINALKKKAETLYRESLMQLPAKKRATLESAMEFLLPTDGELYEKVDKALRATSGSLKP